MSRTSGVLAAMKAVPGGARHTPAPQSGGWGGINQVAANAQWGNPYAAANGYGPFLPRPSRTFTNGAFGPMSPIQPVPVDEPAEPGGFPDPRYWQYPVGYNLPTQPGSEGFKLACYSADTEILTRRGWLSFPELNADDEVATRNPESREFEWQKPTAHHACAYDGELIRFLSRGIDLLVTPNHRVLHTSGNTRAKLSELIKRADECEQLRSGAMIGTSRWEIPDLEGIDVPRCQSHGYVQVDVGALRAARDRLGWSREQLAEKAGTTGRAILNMELGTGKMHAATLARLRALCEALGVSPESIMEPDPLGWIPGDDFAAFMGAYLSEGCVSEGREGSFRIYISQMPHSKGYEPYKALLTRMLGREPYYDSASWSFVHEGFGTYLRQCGHSAPEKRIPREVLDLLSPRQLRIFLDFYRLGDGWTYRNSEAFTTTSGVMAGQIQEVAQKIGLSATVYRRKVKPTSRIRGRLIGSARDRYDIFLRTTKRPKWTSTERVEYEGTVYCVTVPNGIVYVRRNGKAIWSGNSFAQLQTIAEKYSVARRCIQLRKDEICGLEWSIEMTTQAAMAYQNDHKAMRDFGERAAKATKFFKHPDPDYWNFSSWLSAVLEEIFVFDALPLIFRPKYGKGLGRGLLGSDLDSIRLVSGSTIRPLLDMHGATPRPPAPGYSQFLYGVPRSDYQTVISGADIDDYGLTGAEINQFRADTMLYVKMVPRRETPYGFSPVEQALLPIISGLQKQEYQLGWYQEGTVPAVYISPGDPNMTPTQVKELQDALNGIAGDPMYHLKVIVLPPGSKVEPQRPVDLADSFDTLVQTQVCMQLDVMPDELGLLPNVGAAGSGGASNASAIRFASGESRDPKGRKSTKPLLMTLCDIANYVLQDICGQQDMRFQFEGLQAEDDKQSLVERGVQGIQNGLYSIDEVRGWLDLPPWGLPETSEPVVFTAQGPVPFSMAPELIRAAITGNQPPSGQGTNSGQRSPSSRSRTNQPSVRQGGTTKPNGSHPAPVADHREAPLTPGHSAAAGAIQSPTPRTGGTTSRSSVAGSRKKAVESELGALKRHLRKGRLISTWVTEHIPERALGMIAEDVAKGVLLDVAVERAETVCLKADEGWQDEGEPYREQLGIDGTAGDAQDVPHGFTSGDGGCCAACGLSPEASVHKSAAHWPGWERDLGLVGAYKNLIGQAFHDAEARGSELRKKAATGGMFVSSGTLRGLIGDEVREVFSGVLEPLWTEAWNLGYASAKSLVTGEPADFTVKHGGEALAGFLGTEGEHWLDQIGRTGLGNNSVRSEGIAWTEVGRAINSAAIQCYRDHGVTHKGLLLSPNACDLCKDVAEDGPIPLDAPFSAGGVIGQVHIRCRCCPAPSSVAAEPPLAHLGKAQGYSLNPRSGMISLDVPEGTITPVPGGVTDHHITVVYLGPDVDDDAFAQACQRAADAAAGQPGPLVGAIKGVGSFPPSDGSDGKVPAWAGVMLPGAESLRAALEDLSASEHKDWKPHVTLAYVEPGEALPDPVPATPVAFTHLSVHRGHDEVQRFPLGPVPGSAKSAAEDESRLAWLLLRARDEDGKWRFLLQQRPDGTWGMPGGTAYLGEDSWAAAVRETTEEIGALPPLKITGTFHHVEDDGKTQVYLWLCDVPYFHPTLDGATPEETKGVAWFRRKEIGALDLAPKFREDWEKGICLREHVTKALQRTVNENGEVSELTPASQRLQAVGSRWPYPHRADGAEWPDAGPGAVPDEHGSAGGEPPHWTDDMAEPEPHDTLEPRGGDDGKMPSRGRKPNPPASRFPDQGDQDDDMWPYPQTTLTPAASSVGAPKSGGNDSGHPVVGSVPAKTPKPMSPHAVEPVVYDPAEAVEDWSPEAGSDVVHDVGKGASDPHDPNPVEAEHVKNQLRANYPEKSLSWVDGLHWIGPINVPVDRIDFDDEESWAAHHQPQAVNRFARDIKAGTGHTDPVVMVQTPDRPRAVVIDGHHRTLAYRKLGRPVKAYLGTTDKLTPPILETHSSQVHQGADPANKSAQTPVVSTVHHPLGHEGLWHTPDRHVPTVQQLPAYFQNTARALMRDQGMGESEAIATAVNAVDEWRHGTAFGGKQKVTPEVQQAAQRAWDEWERLKESHHP